MRWLASIRRPSLRARIIRSSAERVWIVCVREKKKEKRRAERCSLYKVLDGSRKWWCEIQKKERTARCCAPLLHGHISQQEGEYNRKKEERINHGWKDKRKKKEILPCCLSISSLIAPFLFFFIFCYIDPHPWCWFLIFSVLVYIYWCYTQGHRDGLYILLRDEYVSIRKVLLDTPEERERRLAE